MSKLLARMLFVLVPALALGTVLSLIDLGLGLIMFLAITYLGIEMTRVNPERGE
jgi:hypothetical protein